MRIFHKIRLSSVFFVFLSCFISKGYAAPVILCPGFADGCDSVELEFDELQPVDSFADAASDSHNLIDIDTPHGSHLSRDPFLDELCPESEGNAAESFWGRILGSWSVQDIQHEFARGLMSGGWMTGLNEMERQFAHGRPESSVVKFGLFLLGNWAIKKVLFAVDHPNADKNGLKDRPEKGKVTIEFNQPSTGGAFTGIFFPIRIHKMFPTSLIARHSWAGMILGGYCLYRDSPGWGKRSR